MDFKILLEDTGVVDILPEADEPLRGAMILSVYIPRGKWWQSPEFGNGMSSLSRAKLTPSLPTRLRQSLINCIGWIRQTGKARQIDVAVATAGASHINYRLTAYKGGQVIIFDNFYDVSGRSV